MFPKEEATSCLRKITMDFSFPFKDPTLKHFIYEQSCDDQHGQKGSNATYGRYSIDTIDCPPGTSKFNYIFFMLALQNYDQRITIAN